MATTKTKTIAVRVPNEVADALGADAAAFGKTPGQLLRELLQTRYLVSGVARKLHSVAPKTDSDIPWSNAHAPE